MFEGPRPVSHRVIPPPRIRGRAKSIRMGGFVGCEDQWNSRQMAWTGEALMKL